MTDQELREALLLQMSKSNYDLDAGFGDVLENLGLTEAYDSFALSLAHDFSVIVEVKALEWDEADETIFEENFPKQKFMGECFQEFVKTRGAKTIHTSIFSGLLKLPGFPVDLVIFIYPRLHEKFINLINTIQAKGLHTASKKFQNKQNKIETERYVQTVYMASVIKKNLNL